MINKHVATRNLTGGKTARVTVEQGTWTEQKMWDGYDMGAETHVVNRTEIALLENDKVLATDEKVRPLSVGKVRFASQYKQAVASGCVGMIGRTWIRQDTADAVADALAEAEAATSKTLEQTAIENATAKAEAKAKAWRNSPEGKASAEDAERHDRLMRDMDREDSDY